MMFSPALIIRLCFFQITVDEPELEQGKALNFLRVIKYEPQFGHTIQTFNSTCTGLGFCYL